MYMLFLGQDVKLTSLKLPFVVIRLAVVITATVLIWQRYFSDSPVEMAIITGPTVFVIMNGVHQCLAIGLLIVFWKLMNKPTYIKLMLYTSHRIYEVLCMVLVFANPKNAENAKLDFSPIPIVQVLISLTLNLTLIPEFIILWKIFKHIRNGKAGKMLVYNDEKCKKFFKGELEGAMKENQNHFIKPYKKSFEVTKEQFRLDEGEILGYGSHGVVFKGKYPSKHENIEVAIKVYKTEDIDQLTRALTELKILMYIEEHENILSLFKASTKNIRWGELMILTLLCHNGNLETFLRQNRHKYSERDLKESKSGYENIDISISKADLMKFSIETATAMEFLYLKKIVHRDLAARNIFLTIDNTVKVGDFGLSQHLYNYKLYKHQSKECELPWRWMAPESLTDLKFSVNSDIWSFGVTMWEIFSLGDVPYGDKIWEFGFTLDLSAGFRLIKPQHCSSDLYEEVIINCWHILEAERYSFSKLLELLRDPKW